MKKNLISVIAILALGFSLSAQANVSIDIDEDIYYMLDYAQIKGYCHTLSGNKPYGQSEILEAVNEILEHSEELSQAEINTLNSFVQKVSFDDSGKNSVLKIRAKETDKKGNENHFVYDASAETEVSGGIYNKSEFNAVSFDVIPRFKFMGDLMSNYSFMIQVNFDLARTPLLKMGTYHIGSAWYTAPDSDRRVNIFYNPSYLPYRYNKKWDGKMYYFSDFSSSGLEGWPMELAFGGTMQGELKARVLNNKVIISAGRISREVAGMDNGSSLVLNSMARPFLAGEVQVNLLPFLTYTSLTGSLEYPGKDYVFNTGDNATSWYPDPSESTDDTYYFQNNYSLNMVEVDFPWMHWDFGSSVVWPKRLEFGYLFPMANYVEYQNHIGDCDNLGMFTDLKFRVKNYGEIWGSFFLDELNGLNNNPFTNTRDMFAYQAGFKAAIPGLSFGKISFRYTKIEPYCYTHHSINYVPYYSHYISENYTNVGQCIGYYLDPNSDEFRLDFDFIPYDSLHVNGTYQLIRHGADYGSQAVPGSSLYSEMRVTDRDLLRKYFLHDGAYNWSHVLSASASMEFHNLPVKLEVYGTAGCVFSYYTIIDQSLYTSDGNCEKVDFKTPIQIADNDEYPNLFGGVLTVGAKVKF